MCQETMQFVFGGIWSYHQHLVSTKIDRFGMVLAFLVIDGLYHKGEQRDVTRTNSTYSSHFRHDDDLAGDGKSGKRTTDL
jgi:hypothetical protein